MNLTIAFEKPEIKTTFDWQLTQEVNALDESGKIVAKAEIEIITLNKHRGARQSVDALNENAATDWELPLNLYFKGQSVNADLCEFLEVKPEVKKAKDHIMIEALSVIPTMRGKGVSRLLLKTIAEKYSKAQSIWLLSMPMHYFVDADDVESEEIKAYYQTLALKSDETTTEQLANYFTHVGFKAIEVDSSLLVEPLQFDLFVTTPTLIA